MNLGLPRKLLDVAPAPGEEMQRAAWALVDMVNAHDTYTGGHSLRVAHFAAGLARVMGLAPAQIKLVRQAGLVHDIGKVAIPDKLLRKRGPLSDEEYHLVKLHPIFGASILSRIPESEEMIPIVLHHHERWDGLGYPTGLSGVDVPLEARIIFVADAFDAMTSVRSYGQTFDVEGALAEMRKASGKQFDPLAVDGMHEAFRFGLLDEPADIPTQVSL